MRHSSTPQNQHNVFNYHNSVSVSGRSKRLVINLQVTDHVAKILKLPDLIHVIRLGSQAWPHPSGICPISGRRAVRAVDGVQQMAFAA